MHFVILTFNVFEMKKVLNVKLKPGYNNPLYDFIYRNNYFISNILKE